MQMQKSGEIIDFPTNISSSYSVSDVILSSTTTQMNSISHRSQRLMWVVLTFSSHEDGEALWRCSEVTDRVLRGRVRTVNYQEEL